MIDELLELEQAVWDALVAGDAAADAALLTDDFVGVYPTGVTTRSAHVANAAAPVFASYTLSQTRVIDVSPDAKLLTYRADYRRTGHSSGEETMFISSLWVRTEDGWKNSFSQDTPMAGRTDLVPTNVFRANAGAVVRHPDGRVLVFRRSDWADAWQFPQGGMDPGESALDAMWRELAEETGLGASLFVSATEVPGVLGYELPDEYRHGKAIARGQAQKWFVAQVADAQVAEVEERLEALPPGEFDAWRWAPMAEVVAGVPEFRRPTYERVADFLTDLD